MDQESRPRNHRIAKGVAIGLGAVVLLGPAIGVAASAVPGLSMLGGDTSHVTCAGKSLSVSNKVANSLDLTCKADTVPPSTVPPVATPTTTPPPTTPPPTTTPTTTPPPTTPPPTTPPSITTPAAGTWWTPPLGNVPWQWEIDHPLNLNSASDMGTGVTTYTGAPAPNPMVYDIDGIENPASTVAALHAAGDHAICYVEVGTAGNYYSAADEGIPTTYYAQFQAAGVLGDKLSGYPESFLNITSAATVSIVESMIQQQCAAKGFDAVETDLDETYSGSDGTTGFIISKAAEEQYMTTLATFMHAHGLGWIIKNPDDTGDSYAADMEPLADGVLTEQCNEYQTCSLLSSYVGHKAVLNAEYNLATSAFCPADNAAGFNGARFNVNLNGGRQPCR
jgi:hypothetical protein